MYGIYNKQKKVKTKLKITDMTNKDPNQKKGYVLDTNVLAHDPRSIYSFKEHDVIILTTVLGELDNLKNGNDAKAYTAREIHRELDVFGEELISVPTSKGNKNNTNTTTKKVSALFHGGVSLGEGLGKIEIKNAPRKIHKTIQSLYFDEKQENDNRILSTVFEMQVEPKEKRRIILVCKDINMRLKAKSMGIEVQDYESDKIPDIEKLYLGREELVDDRLYEAIDVLHKTKQIPIFGQSYSEVFKAGSIIPNKFFVLKANGNKSVLAVVDKNMVHLRLVEKKSIAGIVPRNSEQAFSIDALLNDDVKLVTLLGKAGTGKTLLAMAAGIHLLSTPREKPYERLIIATAMMTLSNKDMGALPGDAKQKVLPYMQGLYDNLSFIKSQNKGKEKLIKEPKEPVPQKQKKSGNKQKQKAILPELQLDYISELQEYAKIEVQPIAYIRGRSLNNVIFIVDESQNLTPHEVKTIVTRAGENCKIVFSGDIQQIDTPYLDARSSGLSHIVHTMGGKKIVAHVTLVKGERSELAELAADLM